MSNSSPDDSEPDKPPSDTDGSESSDLKEDLQTTAKQSSAIGLVKVAGMGAGFATSYVLARVFGPQALGDYTLVRVIVSIAAVVTVFGLNNTLIKFIPEIRSDEDDSPVQQLIGLVFGTALGLAAVGATVFWAGRHLVATYLFDNDRLPQLLVIGAAVLIPFTLIRVSNGLLRAYRRATIFNTLDILVRKVALLVVVGTCALLGWTESSHAVGAWGVALSVTLIGIVLVASRLPIDYSLSHFVDGIMTPSKFDRRRVLGYSSTMILISVVSLVMTKVDVLMLGYFTDSAEIGIYKIALTLSVLTSFVHTSANSIFAPVISDLCAEGNIDRLERTYSVVTKWITIVGFPIFVSFFFYPDVATRFFGPEFVEGTAALWILALGEFIRVVVGANGYILNFSGYEKLMVVNNGTIAVFNVLLNLYLIPKIGITGAAIATTFATGSINIIKVFELQYLLDVFPYRKNFLPVVLSSPIVVGVAALADPIVINVWLIAIVTLVNMGIGVVISWWFASELENELFEWAFSRVRNRLPFG